MLCVVHNHLMKIMERVRPYLVLESLITHLLFFFIFNILLAVRVDATERVMVVRLRIR